MAPKDLDPRDFDLDNPGVRAIVCRFASTPIAARAIPEEIACQSGNAEFAGMAAEMLRVKLRHLSKLLTCTCIKTCPFCNGETPKRKVGNR